MEFTINETLRSGEGTLPAKRQFKANTKKYPKLVCAIRKSHLLAWDILNLMTIGFASLYPTYKVRVDNPLMFTTDSIRNFDDPLQYSVPYLLHEL